MDKNDDKRKLDMLPNMMYSLDDEDRIPNNIIKVLTGMSLSVAVSLLFTSGSLSLIPILLTSIVIVPITCFTLTKIKERSDASFNRDMYEATMICSYLREARSKEHILDEYTTSFFKEIDEYKFSMSFENQLNLNQLLFLINKDFYEEINKYTRLTRHSLITKLLDSAKVYIDNTYPNGNATFDIDDATKLIDTCIFIPYILKSAIIEAFASSRVNAKRLSFVIPPKDNIFGPNFYKSEEHVKSEFDINDIENYKLIKSLYEKIEINEYKDAYLLEWDLEFLKDCMSLIVRRFGTFISSRQDDIYHFDMVSTFMYHLSAYASLNKSESVGIKEIINTFKGFDYFDFALKLDILDAIFEEFNLDMSMHPYRDKPVTKPIGKIYNFPSNKDNKK